MWVIRETPEKIGRLGPYEDVLTFYRPIGKTKVQKGSFNQFVYKFYLQRMLILEEYLLKW